MHAGRHAAGRTAEADAIAARIRTAITRNSSQSPPWMEGLPAAEGWMGTDTGSTGSVAIDSGPPTAATLGPTNVEKEVAATGATSLGSTSLHSYLTRPLRSGTG